MIGRRYYVVRHDDNSHDNTPLEREGEKRYKNGDDVIFTGKAEVDGKGYEAKFAVPYIKAMKAMMQAEGFADYIRRNGMHFTPELAEYASAMLVNVDAGDKHTWKVEEVADALQRYDLSVPSTVTMADVTYEANKKYSDYYNSVLSGEVACIKLAVADANDPGGYDGMIFFHFLADVMGKKMKVDWKSF